VTRALGKLIAQDARKKNASGAVSGDIECDGHAVRSMHVSKTNPKFLQLHPKSTNKSKRALRLRGVKHFLMYLRVLGLRKRGREKLYIAFADQMLLPPRSRPPPSNTEEIVQSGILDRAAAKSVVHFDGAPAWPAAIARGYKRKRFTVRKVVHKNMEFAAKCRRVRLPNGKLSASLTGTQCIDSTWGTLNHYIPRGLSSKSEKSVNPELYNQIFQWLWWTNNRTTSGFNACGRLVQSWRASSS
jgi:hypothetical protein